MTAAFATLRNPGTRSYGPAVVEQLAAAGVGLFGWQADWLDELLEVDELGRLTRRTATLLCPRRNGKTLAIAARSLAGIAFLDELRVLYTAHNGDTANEVFGMMTQLCQLEAVRPLVSGVYRANGKERIEFHNGGRFQVRTRTEHGGRGRETDLLIFDEAMILDDAHVAALRPLTAAAAARGRGQTIYASSAGTDASTILLELAGAGRELHGRPGGSIAYREYCATRADDPRDPDAWARANPSLGTVVLDPGFLEAQLAGMTLESFRREHLGIWSATGELPAIDPDAWAALASQDPVDVDPDTVAVAFDVSLDRTAARIVAVARSVDGRLVVRQLASWTELGGIDAQLVVDELVELYDELGPLWIAYDKLGGGDVAAQLEARRYPVKAFPLVAVANACSVLDHAVRAGRLVHDGAVELADDLSRGVPRPYADGGWTFTRKAVTTGPIAGAIALALGVAAVQLAGEAEAVVATAGS